MISCVICSKSAVHIKEISENIAATIGVKHEIIIQSNANTVGLCAAYNAGAARAVYNYLCFVHDDVTFITDNWGVNIINHLEASDDTGVIGIAGSVCKSKMPSGWIQPKVSSVNPNRMNILQEYKYEVAKCIHYCINPFNEVRSLVATLDGVFLATKKTTWKDYLFDERLLKGFHGYDLEFSINTGRTKKNYVVYDILLRHKSEGKFGMSWLKNILLVHKKWNAILPVNKSNLINKKDLSIIDNYCFSELLLIKATNWKERYQKLFYCLRLIPVIGFINFWKKHRLNFLRLLFNRHPLPNVSFSYF